MRCIVLIQENKCSEEEIEDAFKDLGYKHPEDYLTVDEACNYLGVCRSTFYILANKYALINEKFKNAPAGYYKPRLRVIKQLITNTP